MLSGTEALLGFKSFKSFCIPFASTFVGGALLVGVRMGWECACATERSGSSKQPKKFSENKGNHTDINPNLNLIS